MSSQGLSQRAVSTLPAETSNRLKWLTVVDCAIGAIAVRWPGAPFWDNPAYAAVAKHVIGRIPKSQGIDDNTRANCCGHDRGLATGSKRSRGEHLKRSPTDGHTPSTPEKGRMTVLADAHIGSDGHKDRPANRCPPLSCVSIMNCRHAKNNTHNPRWHLSHWCSLMPLRPHWRVINDVKHFATHPVAIITQGGSGALASVSMGGWP